MTTTLAVPDKLWLVEEFDRQYQLLYPALGQYFTAELSLVLNALGDSLRVMSGVAVSTAELPFVICLPFPAVPAKRQLHIIELHGKPGFSRLDEEQKWQNILPLPATPYLAVGVGCLPACYPSSREAQAALHDRGLQALTGEAGVGAVRAEPDWLMRHPLQLLGSAPERDQHAMPVIFLDGGSPRLDWRSRFAPNGNFVTPYCRRFLTV